MGVPSFSRCELTKLYSFNSVALSATISVAFHSTEDFHYHRSRKNKKPRFVRNRVFKERRRHTLPQIAVPSAQAGLTSLFGMGRGEPRRNNHLKILFKVSGFFCCKLRTWNFKPKTLNAASLQYLNILR